jgi:cysteine desulfurase
MLYLDHCASTPCDPQVIQAMTESLQQYHANSSSTHAWGWQAREVIENARLNLAQLVNVRPKTLTFTSGATEANHLALLGIAHHYPGCHIITQATEHKAVLDPLERLIKQGYTVTTLPVNTQGLVDLDVIRTAITPHTRCVSIMHVNNELGVIQPIEQIAKIVRQYADPACVLHVDAAQSIGKIHVDLNALDIDLCSIAGHKFYAPKGVGALYIKHKKLRASDWEINPLWVGGGQERGLRPGTIATHQVYALGTAAHVAQHALNNGEMEQIASIRDALWQEIKTRWPDTRWNAQHAPLIPGILNLCCGEDLLQYFLDRADRIAFSRGAACQSHSQAPSYVLQAIGLTAQDAFHSIRLCIGRYQSLSHIQSILFDKN